MPILLDYQDRQVRLTEERLAHILTHPEMIGMESQIANTLKILNWFVNLRVMIVQNCFISFIPRP
jgi:hypothetical protein